MTANHSPAIFSRGKDQADAQTLEILAAIELTRQHSSQSGWSAATRRSTKPLARRGTPKWGVAKAMCEELNKLSVDAM